MTRFFRWGVCAVTLWGGAALAQGAGYAEPESTTVTTVRVEEDKNDPGPYVLLGGGAEAYTGELAPNVNPGFSYGIQGGIRPVPGLGFELGYNGGLVDIDVGPGGLTDGADVVRNAGQLAVVGDVPLGDFSPYALTGIGIDNFNVRAEELTDFEDDTSGYIPAGLGLRYHFTDIISADARVTYNIPFAQDFAPFDTGAGSGRIQGLLQIGGSY